MIKGIRLNFSSPKIESSGTYLLREGDKQLGSCLFLPAAPKFIPMTKINHQFCTNSPSCTFEMEHCEYIWSQDLIHLSFLKC